MMRPTFIPRLDLVPVGALYAMAVMLLWTSFGPPRLPAASPAEPTTRTTWADRDQAIVSFEQEKPDRDE